MLLRDVVETSARVGASAGRLDKVAALAELLARLPPAEAPIAIGYLTGRLPQGRIGIGGSLLACARSRPAATASLTLTEVDRAFRLLSQTKGAGSTSSRREALAGLYRRATAEEQSFLERLVVGELRQGALEGVMLDAVAAATGIASAELRAAAMLAGDLPTVASVALAEGRAGLSRFGLRLFTPVKPMLAQPVADLAEALGTLGTAALEYKLDGARVQVHKAGNEVRVYSRRLNDVTDSVPEVVEAARDLPADRLVLDGETIALTPSGRPQPFQLTMRRFGRRFEVERLRAELPLAVFFFDCLHRDGEDLVARSTADRFGVLASVVPPGRRVERAVTSEPGEAEAFLMDALARGHEGVMAKSLSAPYMAGARGSGWLKIKRAHTLDLVVLAAEWGHGRRRGWLSNLHLGARDPASGGYVMLGKTFKGMTDEALAWQTGRLLALAERRDRDAVYVRPALVVEVAFNDVQASPQYPAGLALRFARVKAYRPDKTPEEADTVETVRRLYARQTSAPAERTP
ncbi:ATP-dependent DNA ligase [Sulfurifustis variabilis]|uniref:Probable DNA ligase n=1 Tax=Sulfurifustis variabilis TaxID=1675686 RepID=A0A1B4V8A1_9GAMM|nr:ATP-dependent DNA ligase [Sulfurifustis variabilis]BAU47624.1 ATP-dependent DNA ligase [Sulfurifustis variabilis]